MSIDQYSNKNRGGARDAIDRQLMAAGGGRVSFLQGLWPMVDYPCPRGWSGTCEYRGNNNWTQWVIETKRGEGEDEEEE